MKQENNLILKAAEVFIEFDNKKPLYLGSKIEKNNNDYETTYYLSDLEKTYKIFIVNSDCGRYLDNVVHIYNTDSEVFLKYKIDEHWTTVTEDYTGTIHLLNKYGTTVFEILYSDDYYHPNDRIVVNLSYWLDN